MSRGALFGAAGRESGRALRKALLLEGWALQMFLLKLLGSKDASIEEVMHHNGIRFERSLPATCTEGPEGALHELRKVKKRKRRSHGESKKRDKRSRRRQRSSSSDSKGSDLGAMERASAGFSSTWRLDLGGMHVESSAVFIKEYIVAHAFRTWTDEHSIV
jgi:hypothetical protein